MKVLIVGNGVAGMKVAEDVRKHAPSAEIHVFTDEPHGYYSRVWLPELISGVKTVEKIIMRDEAWYAAKGMHLHLATRVTGIDVAARTISTAGKEGTATVNWDKLCICTGAANFVPPITNADLPGVFTLRTIDDALAIKAHIAGKARAVCIGGGLLGLEAARNLLKAGLEVTVVEYFPRLLPRQLCNASATVLQDKINGLGIKTILSASVQEITGKETVAGVRLMDGREIPADTVLVSAGIRPRVELVQGTTIAAGKAIIVDEHMRTSVDGIYAAGDAAEFNGRSWGIIPAALEQATVAARAIAGVDGEPYVPTTPSNKLKVLDVELMSAGTAILDDEDENCRVFIKKDELKGMYKKFVVKEGKLIGSILIEAKEDERFVTSKMNKQVSDEEIQEHL